MAKTKEPIAKANSNAHRPSEEPARKSAVKVRTASKKQFDEAQRKTTSAHAGLFRRLAK